MDGVDSGSPARGRPLGPFALLALGINGIVGVGIFFAPKVVAESVPGERGLLVYVATALGCLPVALVFARLAARFDQDGGPYVYARAAFGAAPAFAIGWVSYVSAVLSTSAVVVGFVEATASPLGIGSNAGRSMLGAGVAIALAAVLATGLRLSAWVWSLVTVVKLVPLVLVVLWAAFVFTVVPERLSGQGSLATASAAGSLAVAPRGSLGLLAAALEVLFALQGFEIVPLPAGHARRSSRAVPIATIASLVVAAVLYIALHLACVKALPDLAKHAAPLVDAAVVFGGPLLGSVVRGTMVVSSFGIAIGMMAMTPRYLAALGHADGLGASFGAIGERGVPRRAFAVTAGLVVAIVVGSLFVASLSELFALSSLAVLAQYVVTSGALGRLAIARQHGLRPRDAWPVPFALACAGLLVVGARARDLAAVLVVAVLGFVLRGAIRRPPHNGELAG